MLRKVQLFWPLIKHPRPARKQIQFSFFYRCFFLFQKGLVENIPSLTFTHHSNESLYLRLFQVREAVLNSTFKRMALRQNHYTGGWRWEALRGPNETFRTQTIENNGEQKKKSRVALKSASPTGNWYLCAVSFVGIYSLNSANENSQRKLDLRPCTNNSTDSDLVPHRITPSH